MKSDSKQFLDWTGHPFVDSGVAATLIHCEKTDLAEIGFAELEKMKNLLLTIFTTSTWRKSFHNIFTGNCKLLQNSFKTDTKRDEEFTKYLTSLLSNAKELSECGNCVACGQRDADSRKGKTEIPMTGSGSSKGFFPAATDGADFCDVCTFMVQCSPLVYQVCGGARFLVLQSSSQNIKLALAEQALREVNRQIAKNEFTGSMNEGFSNPQNALFHIASALILSSRRLDDEKAAISLYHFSNYLQAPELSVYEMPAAVFSFVRQMQLARFREDWLGIVRRNFFFRSKGKVIPLQAGNITEDNFKKTKNLVYLDLLAGKPIINRFFNNRERTTYCEFDLLKAYLREVLAMDNKRIETIKNVADEIALFIMKSSKGKTRLRDLEISTGFREFNNALRKIYKERIDLNPDKPLFTYEQYANELFPEGAYRFGDTRYLILFRLYEQLHDWLKEQKGISTNEDDVKEIKDKADEFDNAMNGGDLYE